MSLFAELKRRNVFRVAAAYLMFSWLALQVAAVLVPALKLPDWSMMLAIVLLSVGFLPALLFSWIYELTPEGLRREQDVDRAQSVTMETGRKLDMVTIAMVVLALAVLLADRFFFDTPTTTSPRVTRDAGVSVEKGIPVVAVLPFKAAGSDDGGFLAAGLHDDLLTRLARLDAFRVISRTSMMEYADTTKNMRQIGEELGASFILEGGVQSYGGRVRINAQLIDAAVDEHIWAETYDRSLDPENIFDVQGDLARAIAGQMRAALTPADEQLIDAIPTQDIEAYNAYLRGLQLLDQADYNEADLQQTVMAFEEAVEFDPGFAQAWARLSQVRSRHAQISRDVAPASFMQRASLAREALARAQELAPSLYEARIAEAVVLYRLEFEYQKALDVIEELEQHSELEVTALTLKAWLQKRVGRAQQAYDTTLAAWRLAPRSIDVATTLIERAIALRDCEAAGNHVRAALVLAPASISIRTAAASYENSCNGDGRRASELLQALDFANEESWSYWTALTAAVLDGNLALARDVASQASFGDEANVEAKQALDQLWLTMLFNDAERLEADRARVMEVMESHRSTFEASEQVDHAWRMLNYYCLIEDHDGLRRWVPEMRRRHMSFFKGDRSRDADLHSGVAGHFALAGLKEEALAELRQSLEIPGGLLFPFVEEWPEFDSLRDEPEYRRLREEFAPH